MDPVRPLHVMQVILNLDIGGAQEVVRTLSEELMESGCPTVVCSFKDGPLRAQIEREGIPVEVLPQRRYSILAFPFYVREMLAIRRALLDLVQKYQIDVVQTHLLRSLDFLVATLRFGTQRPLVFWTVHNFNFALRPEQLPRFRWLAGAKQAVHSRLYRWMVHWVNGFIAVSNDIEAAILKTIGPVQDRIEIISNGVDTRRYRAAADRSVTRFALGFTGDEILYTVVGTLKEQKGHRYLIEAVVPLISRTPRLHILIVGDGELRGRLEEQVRASAIEEHVHFLGNRSDVPAILSASDAFVLPSLWEGLPMALIEAMASGLPVIATQVSGSQQVVEQDHSGILVPPGEVLPLCQAIEYLLTDPEQARQLGKSARQRIEEAYSARRQAEEHLNLYHRKWGELIHER
jgi:glycosyltransferase involved in cell wall biosynthesis